MSNIKKESKRTETPQQNKTLPLDYKAKQEVRCGELKCEGVHLNPLLEGNAEI